MSGEPHPFDELLQNPESEIRIAHAALLWARDEYPDIAPARYLDRLNGLADRVDAASATSGSERIDALRRVLVESEYYEGNYTDFTDPGNHYINRVIDTRRGVPVSLGAIWLDIAGRLDWPIVGVGTPGHFFVRYENLGDEIIIDPFNRGRELSRDDCEQMLIRVFGAEFALADEHLCTVGTRSVLARMLGNLYATYTNHNDWPRTVKILRRLVAVQPDEALLRAELGRVEVLLDDLNSAAGTLNRALELSGTDEERSTVNHHLIALRSKLNERN